MSKLPTVLEKIVTARKNTLPTLPVDPASLPLSTRSLAESIRSQPRAFIMECKSASPSMGLIRADYDPGALARIYSRYAAGISVLCEPDFFGGSYAHLATVAMATHLPVLCKDFIIDVSQVQAARYYGADAVLLMLSVLSDAEYAALAAEADRLGMDVLTEAVTEEEVRRAVALGAEIIGCNHRDLHDLSIDLSRSARLRPLVPGLFVAESGLRDNQTVRSITADAFLVGSHLTSQPDVDLAARELVYGPNKVCGLTTPALAQSARAAGAVYGGLIVEENSPRSVSRETALEIMRQAPGLRYVQVTRSTSPEPLPGIDALQIHAPYLGEGEKDLIATFPKVWRAIDMTHPDGPQRAVELAPLVDKLILDTGHGGTGNTFDWSRIPPEVRHKSLLAGGIGLDNLAAALSIGTSGVDLNSALEVNGMKDPARIRDCFNIIKNYAAKEN